MAELERIERVPGQLEVPLPGRRVAPVRCGGTACSWTGRRWWPAAEKPCPTCGGDVEVGVRARPRAELVWRSW